MQHMSYKRLGSDVVLRLVAFAPAKFGVASNNERRSRHPCLGLREQRRAKIALGSQPNEKKLERIALTEPNVPQPIQGPDFVGAEALFRKNGEVVEATIAVLINWKKKGV